MAGRNKDEYEARAERLPFETGVRYRSAGSTRWRAGRTVNISRSGVLFRSKHPLTPKVPVDVLLSLPAEIGGEENLRVMCCGYVSRVESERDDRPAAIATAFVDFNLLDHTAQGRRTRQVLQARKRTRNLFHKLNNELQIVLGTCEVALLNDAASEELRSQLNRVLQAGRRAADLVRQINEAANITRYKLS